MLEYITEIEYKKLLGDIIYGIKELDENLLVDFA